MASDDFGGTWRTSTGTRLSTPVTAGTIEKLASGGADQDRILRAGAIAVNPRDGSPHLIYSLTTKERATTILATPDGQGAWQRRDLARDLPDHLHDGMLVVPGGLSFDRSSRLHGVLQRHEAPFGESWGHPSCESLRFAMPPDGSRFEFSSVAAPDPDQPRWLPNLERPTGFNIVPDKPGLLYTIGGPGKKNTELMRTKVVWAA